MFVWQLWQCCNPQRRCWPEATETAQEKSSAESQEPHQIFWDQYRQHTVGDQHYPWQGTDWVFFEECTVWGCIFIYFFLERSLISFDWTDCYYDGCGAWFRVPSLLVHKWFSVLSGDTVHLIFIWSFKHSNTMVAKPVTSSLNSVGRCKVLLDKEISISPLLCEWE